MPPAVAIAGIGAAASIGGGLLASGASKKAAKTAATVSTQNTTENNALAREIYGRNEAHFAPYEQRGFRAGNAIMDLLLGPQTATSALGGMQTNPGYPTAPVNPADSRNLAGRSGDRMAVRPNRIVDNPNPTVQPVGGSALDAFDRFRQGTNYQWRYNEGLKALNGPLATNGMFQSGAADKARIQYGQNFASNELGRYMDLLSAQQGLGFSASSALAGVGQNYAGQVISSNNANASNQANAALVAGNATANMWGNIGQGIGQLGGAIYQSSFAPRPPSGGMSYNPYGGWGP